MSLSRRSFLRGCLGAAAAVVCGVGAAAKAAAEEPVKQFRVGWTAISHEDLRAYHSLEAEQQIIEAMSQEIAKEIDQEILEDLLDQSRIPLIPNFKVRVEKIQPVSRKLL